MEHIGNQLLLKFPKNFRLARLVRLYETANCFVLYETYIVLQALILL